MKKLLKDKSGDLNGFTILLFVMILVIALFLTEYMRVYDLQQHLNDELYRASNLAIKQATLDSYLWDRSSRIDEAVAFDEFYNYLNNDLGLNSALEKYEDGKLIYSLDIESITPDFDNARLEVHARVFADPAFFSFGLQWEFPIRVLSRRIEFF